jgi:hypothetical protein
MTDIAFEDNNPDRGSSSSPVTGYLSRITNGSTSARLEIANTGTDTINFYYRTPGETIYKLIQVSPSASEEFYFKLTTALTIEYYFTGSGGIARISVVSYSAYGSAPEPVTCLTVSGPSGTSDVPIVWDVSAGTSIGDTIVMMRYINTGDNTANFYVRSIDETDFHLYQINPQTSTDREIKLTESLTIEGYLSDETTVQIQVIKTTVTTTIPLTDVTSRLQSLGFSSDNITEAEIRMCLDDITAEVEEAATMYELISTNTISASPIRSAAKALVIRRGTLAQCLSVLRNIGATRGLTSDMIIMSNETASAYNAEYKASLENMNNGYKIGV